MLQPVQVNWCPYLRVSTVEVNPAVKVQRIKRTDSQNLSWEISLLMVSDHLQIQLLVSHFHYVTFDHCDPVLRSLRSLTLGLDQLVFAVKQRQTQSVFKNLEIGLQNVEIYVLESGC